MKISLGKYFAIADAAEKLEPECTKHIAQIRIACAEAEQYCNMVGENELLDKFHKTKEWTQLKGIVEKLHKEEISVKVAELLYNLTSLQEVFRMRQAQATTVLEMIVQAIQTQRFVQITYTRVTDGITKQYQIMPRELVWQDTDVGQRRAVIAESGGKIKLFYISRIRVANWA